MAYSFTVNIVGLPDAADKRAALQQCRERNARLVAVGQAALPLSTNAEIKTAYEAYFLELVSGCHQSYAAQTQKQGALNTVFSEDQLKQLRAGILDRFNAGQTPESILADCIA